MRQDREWRALRPQGASRWRNASKQASRHKLQYHWCRRSHYTSSLYIKLRQLCTDAPCRTVAACAPAVKGAPVAPWKMARYHTLSLAATTRPIETSHTGIWSMHLHVFAGNPLDRGDTYRRDQQWLDEQASNSRSRFLPLWPLNVLLQSEQEARRGSGRPAGIGGPSLDAAPVFPRTGADVSRFALDVV